MKLEPLKAVCAAATPGPRPLVFDTRVIIAGRIVGAMAANDLSVQDATFLSEVTPNVVLALISEIERLRAFRAEAVSSKNEPSSG